MAIDAAPPSGKIASYGDARSGKEQPEHETRDEDDRALRGQQDEQDEQDERGESVPAAWVA